MIDLYHIEMLRFWDPLKSFQNNKKIDKKIYTTETIEASLRFYYFVKHSKNINSHH